MANICCAINSRAATEHVRALPLLSLVMIESTAHLLRDLDSSPGLAGHLVAATSDLALLIEADDTIAAVHVSETGLGRVLDGVDKWAGKPFSACVTPESRGRLRRLLENARREQLSGRVQLNHPGKEDGDVPLSYAALRIHESGRCLALGQDLSAVSTLQRRLIDAQQVLERDYLRAREAETRYRLVFTVSDEALILAEADSGRVLEVNPASLALLETHAASVAGKSVEDLVAPQSHAVLRALLNRVPRGEQRRGVEIELAGCGRPALLLATALREGSRTLILVRLRADPVAATEPVLANEWPLAAATRHAADAFVVTDDAGVVIAANDAFLDLVQMVSEPACIGRPLDEWVGRVAIDVSTLIASVRERGPLRLFSSTLTGALGSRLDVEMSCSGFKDGDAPRYVFVIRNVTRRLKLPPSIDQMAELIGRASLKQISREASELVERLAVEAALRMTGDNRAAAAEVLGISRQSLYVKLRRLGIADQEVENDGTD